MRMRLLYMDIEFFHTFTQYSSILLMYGNPNCPFSAELCRTQLQDEIFRHAVENKSTLPYFTGLDWQPDSWLNDLALNLHNMEYMWVDKPCAAVHPGGHLVEPVPFVPSGNDDWE